jgi:DNA-binding beta-propeller fold protein YncE
LRAGAVRRSVEPTDVAVDASTGTFFVSDDSRKVIYSIDPAEDGLLGTRDDAITELSTAMFGSFDPEGLAFGQGSLFIADGVASEVYRLTPGANGAFDGVAPRGDDEVFSFDVASAGLSDPEGLVFDPVQATLYVIDRTRRGPVAELTTDGELIRTIDLETLNLIAPAGIAIAPSSEDRRSRSLYLVDRGVDNGRDPNENDGRLFEIRIDGL